MDSCGFVFASDEAALSALPWPPPQSFYYSTCRGLKQMQREDAVTIGVENLRRVLLSEAETSDPSVVSKRRRLGQADIGKIHVSRTVLQMPQGGWTQKTCEAVKILYLLAVLAGPASRSFSSKYRGVSWHNQTGKWKAQIKVDSLKYLLCVSAAFVY